MDLRSRSNRIVTIVGAALLASHLILKAVCLQIESGLLNDILDLLRYIQDILIFLLWGASIYWRVVQDHIRRALFSVVGIETFWIALRSVKYTLLNGLETPMRYGWYLYYLPMLMLPAVCLKLAVCLGKNDSPARRRRAALFPALSSLIFLAVITNDLHSLVFDIPAGLDGMRAGNYGYGPAYPVILAYIALCTAAALILMYRNCRRLRKSLSSTLPVIPFLTAAPVYAMNAAGVQHLDITFVTCFCVSVSLEACLQTGIIQTNSGYRHIFRNSSIGMAIVDSDLRKLITSEAYRAVTPAEESAAMSSPHITENDIRLSSSPINYGHVLWQDNVSELMETIREIGRANEILEGKNEALQAEYTSTKRELHLKEKNRLYNMLFDQSESYIRRYDELTRRLADETDQTAYSATAMNIAYVSAFIKRRINIIFLDEEDKQIDCAELRMCIEESLKILRLGGVGCSCTSALTRPMTFEQITSLYENFYNLTAGLIGRITSMTVSLTEQSGSPAIEIAMTGTGDLSDIDGIGRADSEWTVMIR